MKHLSWIAALAALALTQAAQTKPTAVASLRLYVFDCGTLTPNREGVERYHVTTQEVGEIRMPVPCFLIAHPRGTLMWDVGVIPDAVVEAQAGGAKANVNPTVAAVVTRTLTSQLAQAGFTPAKVTYVGISHAHIDHTANLNAFAASTWLTPRAERDFMWTKDNPRVNPTFYTALANSKTVFLDKDEHDVFGDGTVIIKTAPGHTPGHQMVFLRLKNFGPLLLAGDLYHLPEERTLDRVPTFDFDPAMTRATRKSVDAFLAETGAQMWIQHDPATNAPLKKAPEFYD